MMRPLKKCYHPEGCMIPVRHLLPRGKHTSWQDMLFTEVGADIALEDDAGLGATGRVQMLHRIAEFRLFPSTTAIFAKRVTHQRKKQLLRKQGAARSW